MSFFEFPAAEGATAGGDDYSSLLTQRAEAFVRDRGGLVHEDVLVAHVFGTTGTPALWRPLLNQILAKSETLTLRMDGSWAMPLAGGTATSLLPEFVSLDVETTGLQPAKQRIIEVAAIRYRDGQEIERFVTFCNPEQRIPKYITRLTGIDEIDVVEAPRFAEIAETLLDFVGAAPIVGHNVRFDCSFINAELKRIDRPPLGNDRLDTLTLAVRLISGMRRPNLEHVGSTLGLLQNGRVHRASADAELTARVAYALAERAIEGGVRDFGELCAIAAPVRRQKPQRSRGRAPLDRSLLADIPKAPGVYIMRDAFDHVIYVGKAKNLRDRVGSYFSQPLGYTRKMDGLLESLVRIDVEVVGSELEALLVESQLIRRYQPRYNTALRSFEHYPFIRVDVSNPWPRVTMAKARKEDGARYFGPFRNKTGARKSVEFVNRVVPLRTCTRSFKDARSYGSPCLELDLGRCLGPCVGRANRDQYASLVREVVRFFDGDEAALRALLWRDLEDAAERLDYERAAQLRSDLRQVQSVVGAQRLLREAVEAHYLLLVLPSADPEAREVLLVAGGRLWAQIRAFRRRGVDYLAERLAQSWQRLLDSRVPRIDFDSVDDANILNRWLYAHAGHVAIIPLDQPPAVPEWTSMAERALALTDAELVFDQRLTAIDEADSELEAAVG